MFKISDASALEGGVFSVVTELDCLVNTCSDLACLFKQLSENDIFGEEDALFLEKRF